MSLPSYPEYKDSVVTWLDKTPAHWEAMWLGNIASDKNSKFIDGDWIESKDLSDEGYRYLTSGNVGEGIYKEQGQGFISEKTFEALNCTEVFPSDILISRLNMPIARACIVPVLGARIVTCVDNVIVRPNLGFDKKFLVYMLSSKEHFANMENLARGTTMQRISRSTLSRVRFAFPPLSEQSAIANFLDRETAKIDGLIAEQEKLITLLAEKRQATISHTVTKGLNPDAPMKDSGVEWLGEVPAHWEVMRLGSLFKEVAAPGNDDLPVLSVSIHDGVSDKELDENEMDRKVTRSDDRSKYKAVEPGDLTYNMMRAWQGGFGSVTVFGMVSPAYIVARPIRNFSTSIIEQLLRTPQAVTEIKRHSRGITDFRLRLYWDEFKTIHVVLAPIEEQDAILAFLKEDAERINALSNEATRGIALLKERRSALISAAVTGKIDVRQF